MKFLLFNQLLPTWFRERKMFLHKSYTQSFQKIHNYLIISTSLFIV